MLVYLPVRGLSGQTEDRIYNLLAVRSITPKGKYTRMTFPSGKGITVLLPFERFEELPGGIIDFRLDDDE